MFVHIRSFMFVFFFKNTGQNPQQGNSWVNPTAAPTGEALAKYCRDLTSEAENGKLDPVIGRDEEIRRTLQVLARRTKVTNNIIINSKKEFPKRKSIKN